MSKIISLSLKLIDSNYKNSSVSNKIQQELLSYQRDDGFFSDDALENFIAISALFKRQKNILTGRILAKMLKELSRLELHPGGPYLFKNKHSDFTNNVAVAYFLFLNKVSLPNLNNYLDNYLKTNKESLPLLATQLLKNFYFNLEEGEKSKKDPDLMIIRKLIFLANKKFNKLEPAFKKIALAQIKLTIKKNKDRQMSLMAYYFKLALGEKGKIINDQELLNICLANIFYWTAFIIYDDFWDEDEKAYPQILPAANLYARNYIDFYANFLIDKPEFRDFFHNLMDKLDAANTWEILHCRAKIEDSCFIIPTALPDYKDYEVKFYPAAGQILGPIAILVKLGFNLASSEINNLTQYFKNYLIAMQLNDDAHDWQEDLRRGHISTVTLELIKDWQEQHPGSKKINLKNDISELQEIFWFKTIKRISQLALEFSNKSESHLKQLDFLENKEFLFKFIKISRQVALAALEEQQKSCDFLKEFD